MKYRIGIPARAHQDTLAPARLDNRWPRDRKRNKLVKRMLQDATEEFFIGLGHCDVSIKDDEISLGIEPHHQGDNLFILTLSRDKAKSRLERGHAFNDTDSSVRVRTWPYSDYKYRSKFVRFVDHWHAVLFPEVEL